MAIFVKLDTESLNWSKDEVSSGKSMAGKTGFDAKLCLNELYLCFYHDNLV
jgi:hypothetical protein